MKNQIFKAMLMMLATIISFIIVIGVVFFIFILPMYISSLSEYLPLQILYGVTTFFVTGTTAFFIALKLDSVSKPKKKRKNKKI